MPHMGTTKMTYRDTPPEWQEVAKRVSALVQDWSGRADLFTMLAPVELPGKVAAHYIPALAEIHINIKRAFGEADPATIPDLTKRVNQFDYAAPLGAAYHEAMHARYTTADLKGLMDELEPEVLDALMLLEESRIEGWGVKIKPKMAPFLRSAAKTIILGELDEKMVKRLSMSAQAIHSCGIVLARVDAGVLKKRDVKQTQAIITDTLGEPMIEKLRALWREAQTISDMDAERDRLIRIATEWAELTREAAESDPEPDGEPQEGDGEGEPRPLSEEQMEKLKEFLEKLSEAMGEDIERGMVETFRELADDEAEARADEALAERQAEQKEYDQHKDAATKVFTHEEPTGHTNSKVVATRDPLPEERSAAVVVGRMFDKAKYRDRIKTTGTTKAPPGRLRMRAVVASAAGKARGVNIETEPWKRTVRHHVEDPNLTVGIMCDVSGSMSSAMQPMGTAAWVVSEAIKRIQGKAAMVYFGAAVRPALKPGEHLEKVAIHSARDGSEDFDGGFKALDGALNLLHGSGARLLVIVSDGQYTPDQAPKCERWLARCRQAGVAVLWIGYGNTTGEKGRYGRYGAELYCADSGAEFVKPSGNITDDAMLIGRAGEKALSQIGSRSM